MKAKDLMAWIDSLTQDIDFEYKGKLGSICPDNRHNISLCYDGEPVNVHSAEEAMNTPFIEGHSLSDICEQLII